MKYEKVGRNAPCPCGSGRKYKQCHALEERRNGRWIAIVIGGVLLLATLAYMNALRNRDPSQAGPLPGQVWSEEHGHYH
jgi:hypothetical protein